MRIIAGDMRGRHIKTRKDPAVRPISGRIKQSLFDIVAKMVPGSKWLDLFAGTGAVGIEAISRGAEYAFFVDIDKANVEWINANLERSGLVKKGKAHPGNVLSDLSWVSYRSAITAFDFVFLGPPYKTVDKTPLAFSTPALARVCESGLLAPAGWIILQHHMKEDVVIPEGFMMSRRERYGDTHLDFIRRKKQGE